MIYLWVVSILWAFSFGFIKGELTGLPSGFVAMVRMAIALLVFIPFFRPEVFKDKITLKLFGIGALQFGFMYLLYIQSFQYLQAHEVALFTITTPFFVTLLYDFFDKKIRINHLIWVCVCIVGSAVITFSELTRSNFWLGFFLLQLSNFCFALGQVLYKRLFENEKQDQKKAFVPMYFGALCVTMGLSLWNNSMTGFEVTQRQWLILLYLGVLPSGLGFFLWNKGAVTVSSGTLAIMNNMKIPLAIIVAVLLFGEHTNFVRLVVGGSIIVLSLILNEKKPLKSSY